ncbi:hypothetical protein JCM8547_001081 [Rhodosporidiobolus lusitaniae]
MRERRSYRGEGRGAPSYPPVSAAAPQGPYGESYPAYDYTPNAVPSGGPSQNYQVSPHQPHSGNNSAPSSNYAPSHPRSRSSSAEDPSTAAHAPIQSTFVLPTAPFQQPSVSPTTPYHPHNQSQQNPPPPGSQAPPIPSLTSSFFNQAPPAPAQTIYRDRFSHPQYGRPAHLNLQNRSASASYAAGLVGGADGWGDAPLPSPSLEYPPSEYPSATNTPVLTSAPLTRQNSSSTTAKGKAAASGAGKAAKANAPRKRVPASCKPCRAKKLRCSRSLPCSSCVERGDPEGCIWEGDATPLYTLRDDNDTKDLKAQVDRLQHLLDALTQQTPSLPSGSGRESVARPSLPHRATTAFEHVHDHDNSHQHAHVPETKFDLHAQDICEALSELALNGVMPPQHSGSESFAPGGGSGEAFVDEARQFLLTFTQRLGLAGTDLPFTLLTPTSSLSSNYNSPDASMTASEHLSAASSPGRVTSPSALGLSAALFNVRPTLSHILDLLPSLENLQSTYKFYVSYVHWYSSPLNLPAVEKQFPAFRAALAEEDPAKREAAVDPLFVATLMGACASGLASMTDKQAVQRGFPAKDRAPIVEKWTQAAVLSLVAGRFMEEPSIEGTRAVVVLSSLYIEQFMTSGETIAAGMSLLSLAVHAAFALNLHRDPAQKGKAQYSFAECEDRRRLFWCLFTLCMSITTGTSRTWSQFDLRQIDCKFPLDCFDAELQMDERAAKARVRGRLHGEKFEETPMTASVVRAQYSLLVKKITDTAFGVKPCKYSDILALDAELRSFEKSFPSIYAIPEDGRPRFGVPPSLTEMKCALIQLCLSAEYVRLHRPFLVLAATDDQYQHSREQCVKYAKRMLAINATPGCKLNWAGHNFKVLSAAVVLGIELLQSPNEPDADTIRGMVDAAVSQAEGFASVSSVCRKGTGVVRFILTKVDEEAATTTQPRQAKRARTLVYNPDDVKPQRRSLADALGGFDSRATSRSNSPDRSSRRRKPTRPPLLHVQSDTLVAQVHTTTARPVAPDLRRGSRSQSLDDGLPTLATLQAQQDRHVPGPVALNPPPTLTYSASFEDRPIHGLPGSGYRRSRQNGSASSVESGYAQHLSSPDMGLPLSLPNPPPVGAAPGTLQLPPLHGAPSGVDAYMSFADMTQGNHPAPLSSSSLFDERDVQSFFSLPSQLANAEEEKDELRTPRLGGLEGGDGGQRAPSRFNVPLEDQELRY